MNKPPKPYPDFPLDAHASGHWAKKIRGKTRYFGRWEDGWEAALERFNDEREALYAGHDPLNYNAGLTVGTALDLFLSAKLSLVESGDLQRRTYADYDATCSSVAKAFGTGRSIESLTPGDFETLRESLAKRYGPVRLAREVTQVRSIFKYCYEAGHLEHPVRVGPLFKPPKQRELRLNRHRHGPKLFDPSELKELISRAKRPLKAMVLLGINCGFGNHDCGLLRFSDLELDTGWHNMARNKTGVSRRAKLWPETVAALEEAIDRRPDSRTEFAELVFVTKRGNSWYKEIADSPVSKQFRKLLDECGLYRPGRTFYALRHSFETIAGESRDQVAVNHIMGHVQTDMASVYRERMTDDRLSDVASFVWRWLFAKESAKIA